LLRLRTYLMRMNVWDKAQDEQLGRACLAQVEQAVDAYLAVPPPDTAAMFDHLYEALPLAMREQLAMAQRFAPAAGNRHG
jgi:pyruvate dehydrogenase E1 component alpha subunit